MRAAEGIVSLRSLVEGETGLAILADLRKTGG